MPRTKVDRRIIKTKRAICNALMQLLAERELDDITITELTSRADINRKTFYLHYACIKDVADEIEKKLRDGFCAAIDASYTEDGTFVPAKFFAQLQEKIAANMEFFRSFCLENTCAYFVRTVGDSVMEKLFSVYRGTSSLDGAALRLSLMNLVSGALHTYLDWIRHPSSITLEEVTALATRFVESDTALINGADVAGKN